MSRTIKLVVCDLDNTLYDWVTFFATAFYAMVEKATQILDVDREVLLDELRTVHRAYHNSEQPFALLETESVRNRLGHLPKHEQLTNLNEAFHAFNSARKRTLELYPGVAETLAEVRRRGIRLSAHTEATVTNAQFRLGKLGISKYFEHLYALEHAGEPHPAPDRVEPVHGVKSVRLIRQDERKPDPRVLRDISQDMQVPLHQTLYVGDSIVRDVGMAKEAGCWAGWAQYGTKFDPECWKRLVRVTHWTDEDVRKAQADQHRLAGTKPDIVLSSFSEILMFIES